MGPTIETQEGRTGGDGVGTFHDDDVPSDRIPSREAMADELRRLAQKTRVWVLGHPLAAIGIAVAAGFMLGRVRRR